MKTAHFVRLIFTFCLTFLRAGPVSAQGPDFLSAIATAADFEQVSAPSDPGTGAERFTKYLIPATDDPTLLPPVFQNVSKYRLHEDFMRAVFPERFPGLTNDQYRALVEVRQTRKYYAGAVLEFNTAGGTVYGFSVFTKESPEELPSVEETRSIFTTLGKVFQLPGLAYAPPEESLAADRAREWTDPPFPIYFAGGTESTYIPYTHAVGYGMVRCLTLEEFEEADGQGLFTWQDVLVIEIAPRDIEGVVAGVITAEPQGILSHVAVRTARRGTPNAYLKGALEIFEPLEGKLLRLEVEATDYVVAEAPLAEAKAWWAEHRPHLSDLPGADFEYAELDSLEEIDVTSPGARPEARFGGKASNFARLQRILTGSYERYREKGFGIPVKYYRDFLRANIAPSPRDPLRAVTYEEYLAELLAWDRFQSDSQFRFAALRDFRDMIEDDGFVDPDLVARLAERITAVFGSSKVPVRFRSSSNIEDALEFNGAGLYDSTGACAADDLDSDERGPSRCDSGEQKERNIARALKLVWASLWTFRAYEERAWYQIPQEQTAMGILVSSAFLDEEANGVAFTGNPSNALDRRYVVTAQKGEASVVHPEPGTRVEKDVLEVDAGSVVDIDRVEASSLVPAGQHVISDEKLRELGSVLWRIEEELPDFIDPAGHDVSEIIFDIEFKVEAGGNLAVKQVRPFLAPMPAAGPTFQLVIPEGTVVCGVFADGRELAAEYEVKSQVRFVPGTYDLPTTAPRFTASLVEELVFGPSQVRAASLRPGRFGLETHVDGGRVYYFFKYQEDFSVPRGEGLEPEVLALELRLDFERSSGQEGDLALTFDEDYLARGLFMTAQPGADTLRNVRYRSCTYETLPLWSIRAELAGGGLVELEERFLLPGAFSGPANLMGARVTLGGATREVRDYWHLVYAAQHHNVEVAHWVVLEPPLDVASLAQPVRVVELHEPEIAANRPGRCSLLGPGLQVLAEPRVTCYRRGSFGEVLGCGFLRGDADSSGAVNITDGVFVLLSLFQGGPATKCPDAADVDDDGIIEITDVIYILVYLFKGVDFIEAPGPTECGDDPTADDLGECLDSGCF